MLKWNWPGVLLVTLSHQVFASNYHAEVEICAIRRAQGVSPELLTKCGKRWAVKNVGRVTEYWEVHEAIFYWDSLCTIKLPFVDTFESSVMSTLQDNVGSRAFDDDLSTRWSANCRYLMGGCAPYAEHVGIDTTGYLPVNLDPASQYSNVKCLKLYQARNQTRQANRVAVVTFVNDTAQGYHVVSTYSDLTGGYWQKRPALEHQMWRLWNLSPIPRPWEVAEIMFYSDTFCTKQAEGVVISSPSFWHPGCIEGKFCDFYDPAFVADGVKKDGMLYPEPLPTVWRAGCHFFNGCAEKEAWIGLDFGMTPISVQCIRIFQPTYEGYPDWGYPTHSPALLLQSWDGYVWRDTSEFHGFTHGVYNDTRPEARGAWAITNYDRTQAAWEIYELGFFEDVDCGVPAADDHQIIGLAINSNPEKTFAEQYQECRKTKGSCAELASDSRTDTAWQSSCSPCEQFDAWIGLLLRGKSRNVRCFRLFQSSEIEHLSAAVQLSYWDGERWDKSRLEIGVGGGTWNFRPAAPRTMWRFYSSSETVLPWTLMGFLMYSDANCNYEVKATAISSGSKPGFPVAHAFDENDETSWEASCRAPKTGMSGCATGSAWIGAQSPLAELTIGCFRVMQHPQRDRQVQHARVQIWDGVSWVMSRQFADFKDFGGGAWQMFPGARGSMWRVTTQPTSDLVGFGVTELQFYRSSDCVDGAVEASVPNQMPICSGYSTSREVFDATGFSGHMLEIGDWGATTPDLAFDNNLKTFWADITTSHSWIGLDVTTQTLDVRCVRLALAGVHSLQASGAEVQAWDGEMWTTYAVAASPWKAVLHFAAPTIGGIGFQRRPLVRRTMWRLQNEQEMSGWEVMEVKFYKYDDCSGEVVTGNAISSIPKTNSEQLNMEHYIPALAFDGSLDTLWSADCPGGCGPGKAWIGLDTHDPVTVHCVRIYQTGQRLLKAENVALAVWEGDRWDISMRYTGLGGGTWHMRPAAPDTMWRVTFMRPAELCPGHGRGWFKRSWGVSELELYADDDCTEELPGPADGATIIASGTRQRSLRGGSSFGPERAFDGDRKSFWAAQCGHQLGSDEAFCTAGLEWIGLDFNSIKSGGAKDVRCFKIHQNRASQRECCDPAEEVRLERWTGKAWVLTSWRHQPLNKPVMQISGVFSRMGACAAGQGQIISRGFADVMEERRRRQSDECIVPLSASVRLLSDPLCDKHSRCAEAGYTGQCCPIDPSLGLSRCCCDFLMTDRVFEDEYEKDIDRDLFNMYPIFGLEYAVIRSVFVLPFIGLFIAIVMYLLANVPQQTPNKRCCWRPYMAICYPYQCWLRSESYIASGVAFFVLRTKGQNANAMRLKGLAWLAVGFIGGGGVFWLMISYIVAEFFIKITVILSLVINVARSPYKPGDPVDELRMKLILGDMVSKVQAWIQFGSLGELAVKIGITSVMFVVYVGRGIFDFVLMRFSLLAIGAADETVGVAEILYYFPELPIDLKPLLELIYDGVGLSGKSFQEAFRWLFMGVPRCEGPVVLFSGMWLIAVTLVLVRWLNYDFFGIFTATKQTVTMTRPLFQKGIGLGVVQGFYGGLFLFMQCIMLLFTRALKLVNPLEESNQQWACPYELDTMCTVVGRTFLIVAAAVALVITFLCANGHFMGQDYIVGEFSRWIRMDLSALDPDGTGHEGGMIRFDTFLAMIPTTFGIWMDRWNVKGFLIEERCSVYASELDLPFTCPVCDKSHVTYTEVMRATGMQLSLAYQLMPAGALIGKACEYLNNPPLFYCGSALKCYNSMKHMRYTMEGTPRKLSGRQSAVVWPTLVVAFLKDMFFPFILRGCCLATYAILVHYSIYIDRQNLEKKASLCFQLLIVFSFARSLAEYLLPSLSLILFGLISRFLPGEKSFKRPPAKQGELRRKLPVVGQIINGVVSGCAVTVYFLVEDPFEFGERLAILFGVSAGIISGFVAVLIGCMLDKFPGSRLCGSGFMIAYLLVISACAAWLMSTKMSFEKMLVLGVSIALVLVFISGAAFRPSVTSRGQEPRPSALVPLLASPRLLCGPVGIIVGVFAAGLAHKGLTDWLGNDYGSLALVLALGLLAGLLIGLCADSIIDQKASQVAIPSGSLVTFVVALLWHWIPGVAAGVAVAGIVGACMEYYVHRSAHRECVIVTPSASKLAAIADADKVSETNSEYPTLCTPTPRSDIAHLKALTMAADTARSPISATITTTSRTKSELGFTSERTDQTPSQSQRWTRPARSPKKYGLAERALNHTPWAVSNEWPDDLPRGTQRGLNGNQQPSNSPAGRPGNERYPAIAGPPSNYVAGGDSMRFTSTDRSVSAEAYPRQASVVKVHSDRSFRHEQREPSSPSPLVS